MKTGEHHASRHVLPCKILLRSFRQVSRRTSQGARILLFALVIAGLSATLSAAQSTSDKTDTDTVRGIVINSVTHEPIEEPLQLLEREALKAGVKDKVVVLEEGVTRFF